MKKSWARRLTVGGIAVLLLAGLVHALMPQPVPADFGAVGQGEMRVTVDDEGRTRVKDVYVVSAPVSGRVLRIEGKVGDPVVAHETVLATIRPTEPAFLDVRSRTQAEATTKAAEAARALAEAERGRAAAELEFAHAELERARPLAVRGTISASALDRAELEVKIRKAALATAEAALRVKNFELATARASLIDPGFPVVEPGAGTNWRVPVPAPVSGRILRVLHESEGVVSAGMPLIEIGDPADLEVVVDLLSADAVRIAEGAEVTIEDWGGLAPLAGRVRRIEPYGFTKISALGIEEQRVNVIIDMTDPPAAWRGLGHGYRVELKITVWRAADVLQVPLAALFRAGDDWAVFAAADGRAELRRITVGHRNAHNAEVLAGLATGDRVVLHPSDRVRHGVRVTARPVGAD